MSDKSSKSANGQPPSASPDIDPAPARQDSRLRVLNRFALDLISIPSESALFWYVAREVVAKLGFDDCVIYLFDPNRKMLRQVAAIGEKNPADETIVNLLEIPLGEGITGQVARTQEAIIVDDLSTDGRYIRDLVEARSEICVPLFVDSEFVGVIDSEDQRPRHFDQEDLEVLATVAAITGAKLSLLRKDNELRASEQNFRALFDTSTAGIGRTLLEDGKVILANRKLAEIFGYDTPEEFIAEFVFSRHYVNPDDRARLMTSYEQSPGTPIECSFTKKNGSIVIVQAHARANSAEGILDFVAIDITNQKSTEAQLSLSVQRLEDIAEVASDWFWELDAELRFTYVSDRYEEVAGVSPTWLLGKRMEEVYPRSAQRQGEAWKDYYAATHSHADFRDFTHDDFRQDGRRRVITSTGKAVLDEEGTFTGYRGTSTDITARIVTEGRLKDVQARLKGALKQANLIYWTYNFSDKKIHDWSDESTAILGIEPENLPETFEAYLKYVHPQDRERVAKWYRVGDPDRPNRKSYTIEYRFLRPDGEVVWLNEAAELQTGSSGKPFGYIGTIQNITALKHAEERLRQAQKMEAVGQLTGGVAHDFNNLLAVIMGNAEILKARLGREETFLDAVLKASRRGAELTQRLLAFSRQQPLRPQVIDLGALVTGMSGLMSRTLGETIEIEIRTESSLHNATADPGQVENALLNLALNARDAMPGGGKLTIECSSIRLDESYVAETPEATAGDYVVLAVSDEGIGMTAEAQAHAFEPFFTTKEVGQGSGLGLSMIYGFAKQSNGQVTIYSEEGRGTTVKLYLPQADAPARHEAASQDQELLLGRGEVVLVIEDDPDVRALALQMVTALEYRVIEAADAAAAQRILAAGEAVDLVLSDVILPGGTSGPEFAEQAGAAHPDLKIVFMSGYPAEAAKRNGFLGSDQVLLNKPFQMQALAKALRQALG